MGAISFKRSSLEDYNKYNSLLVGNAFTPPAVPSAYDLLETTILGSDASSVTFDNLDTVAADYKHLQIRSVVRTTDSQTETGLIFKLNGSTTNYAFHQIFGNGSTVTSSANLSVSFLDAARVPADTATANAFGGSVLDILDYADTSKNTTTRSFGGFSAGSSQVNLKSGLFFNTAAITSVELYSQSGGNLKTGSRLSLYGLKAGS